MAGSVSNPVEPLHLWLEHDDALASGRGSLFSIPIDILLFPGRGDRHCCVDLVSMSVAYSISQAIVEAVR